MSRIEIDLMIDELRKMRDHVSEYNHEMEDKITALIYDACADNAVQTVRSLIKKLLDYGFWAEYVKQHDYLGMETVRLETIWRLVLYIDMGLSCTIALSVPNDEDKE